MSGAERVQPDYEKLRLILEKQLERPVLMDEAVGTGKFLVNVYEVLLSDELVSDTIITDTT